MQHVIKEDFSPSKSEDRDFFHKLSKVCLESAITFMAQLTTHSRYSDGFHLVRKLSVPWTAF